MVHLDVLRLLLLRTGSDVDRIVWRWKQNANTRLGWLPCFINDWLHGPAMDDIGRISRNLRNNLHHRTMWKEEDDGFSILVVCWMCVVDHHNEWVGNCFNLSSTLRPLTIQLHPNLNLLIWTHSNINVKPTNPILSHHAPYPRTHSNFKTFSILSPSVHNLLYFSRVLLTLILFLGRGVIAGLFQAAYVYTPEVYPTNLRSVGVGGCSSLARLGAMCTPYVAQVLFQASKGQAVAVYGIFAICASVACLFLPYETRGNDLATWRLKCPINI